MENYGFNHEELHLDLRPRRKKRFHNKSEINGAKTIIVSSIGSAHETIRIFLLTWNVNSRNAPDDLDTVFPPDADIYAIGLQEAGSFDWVSTFDSLLRPLNVVRIKLRRMQGVITMVYVKRRWLHHLCHIESEVTRTGLSGMWLPSGSWQSLLHSPKASLSWPSVLPALKGNKGGCSIRFDLLGVNLIVVNCHLPAHTERVAQRLEDVYAILDSQKFKDGDVDQIMDHDYVFWMGDLNFRVDNTSFEKAMELIRSKDYEELLKKDQLKALMKEEVVFCGFKESDITFPPSYKFDPGTDVYDSSSKKRVPSYCDRVLYFHHDTTYSKNDTLRATCLEYHSHPSITVSDHKPVSCLIEFHALRCPPSNPIIFHKSKRAATTQTSFPVKFQFKDDLKPASGDWVGLYKTDFLHFDEYLTYEWVSTSDSDEASRTSSVTFPAEAFQRLGTDTSFVTCYISKLRHFSGISERYELVH